MTDLFLSIGSNKGDRVEQLHRAADMLALRFGPPHRCSRVYESVSWGYEGDDFLNVVLLFKTNVKASEVLEIVLGIETDMGRLRSASKTYSDRVIDIDMLSYGSQRLDSPSLILPHPRLHQRLFVLMPLADIAPKLVLPGFEESVQTLLAQCDDESNCCPYDPV